MFVVPSWVPVEHHSADGADLFGFSDATVLRALGLWRQEVLDTPQVVDRYFDRSQASGPPSARTGEHDAPTRQE